MSEREWSAEYYSGAADAFAREALAGEDDATPLETTPTCDAEIAALAERIFERHYPKWQKNHAMQLYECASDAIFAAVEFIRARDAWMEARRDA